MGSIDDRWTRFFHALSSNMNSVQHELNCCNECSRAFHMISHDERPFPHRTRETIVEQLDRMENSSFQLLYRQLEYGENESELETERNSNVNPEVTGEELTANNLSYDNLW